VWSACSSGLLVEGRSHREVARRLGLARDTGPGRSASDTAFVALKKEIAQRYEHAQKEVRKLRAAREQERLRSRRQEDLR
jgi:hypothetical protein